MLQTNKLNSHSLLDLIDINELPYIAPQLFIWKAILKSSVDDIAEHMYQGGPLIMACATRPQLKDTRPARKFWEYVKAEMQAFLCTDDKKYKKLWKEIEVLKKKSTTTIVAAIAAYLGASIGVAGAMLSGFVAVCLFSFIKIGKEAYCKFITEAQLPPTTTAKAKKSSRKTLAPSVARVTLEPPQENTLGTVAAIPATYRTGRKAILKK